MIQNDGRLRKGAGQIRQIQQLRKVHPGVKGQTMFLQASEPPPKLRIRKQFLVRIGSSILDVRARIPGVLVTNPAESVVPGRLVGLEYRCDRSAQRKVGVTHDSGGDGGRPVLAACTARGNALRELGLAHGPSRYGVVLSIHRRALDEHREHDVVAARDVPAETP